MKMDAEQIAKEIKKEIPPQDWHKAKVYFMGDMEKIVRRVIEISTGKHQCSFGFGEGRTFSKEKEDWVCSCGRTRREYLKQQKVITAVKELKD